LLTACKLQQLNLFVTKTLFSNCRNISISDSISVSLKLIVISFRKCLQCDVLQARNLAIISKMKPKQVYISGSG